MKSKSWQSVDQAEAGDVGKIALVPANGWGQTQAIEDTAEACIEVARKIGVGVTHGDDAGETPITMDDVASGAAGLMFVEITDDGERVAEVQ